MKIEDFKISGIAAVTGSLSKDLGGFREIIEPRAFDDILATKPEVRAVINHSRGVLETLGTTENGTLQLRSTDQGLEFELEIAQTQAGRDTVALIERGDITSLSFAFVADQDDWGDYNGETIRTIKSFRALNDISIVSIPAYTQAKIN